ncbi:MAG: NAD(P)/FAD-dependent oxidoreductase [Bacteroidota bacterium]
MTGKLPTKHIAIIGGGAAGFFAAVNCAQMYPQHSITIFEKASKLLSKVRVSGGGRCNVTHACFDIHLLANNYPRGEKQLKSAFSRFMTNNTIDWFAERGVQLKAEADGRMFPVSDSSQTIIDCLMREADQHGVKIEMNADVLRLEKKENGKIELTFRYEERRLFDAVLIASGGNANEAGFDWLKETGHAIVSPVPSLFTFNMPKNPVTELMGVAVEWARIKILQTKYTNEGPLLITHWGMSGPAILKLSAQAARTLAEVKYNFKIQICWLKDKKEDEMRSWFQRIKKDAATKMINNTNEFGLPKRLWYFLLYKSGIEENTQWAQLSKEQLNKLLNNLLYDEYAVSGKTTFKEEFVTCGGVSLNDVDFKTMESKKMKGLYFAGEVLDIDAVTGGFNFQAAWSTGYIAALSMGKIRFENMKI